MDTSVMRKATSDKEKEEYRKTGKCFECGKQDTLHAFAPQKGTDKPRATDLSKSTTTNQTMVSQTSASTWQT